MSIGSFGAMVQWKSSPWRHTQVISFWIEGWSRRFEDWVSAVEGESVAGDAITNHLSSALSSVADLLWGQTRPWPIEVAHFKGRQN